MTNIAFWKVLWLGVALFLAAPRASKAQYTTDWIANTFGTNAAHVGNAARSMWVAPEGLIYTSSMWDENAGSIAMYQNGASVGSFGAHGETQGGAITGNATYVFSALQYNTSYGSGQVGRYVRSSNTRNLLIPVSATTTERLADVITGLTTSGSLLYASDYPGNRVRIFTVDGVWQSDISVAGPGALAVDSAGNIWVARMAAGVVAEYSSAGVLLNTITLATSARPSALYYDVPTSQLYIGDQGPDMNIKVYNIASSAPVFASTFGITGGYLDTTAAVKGSVGAKRFTRIAGIGKDSSNNLYVLNNPWGGSWDLGRNGVTDIHAYNPYGTLLWKLQGLNFESVGAPDPAHDGTWFYSGTNVYNGTAGGAFIANTVDPITYPNDARINFADPGRGEHFGQIAAIGGRRILAAGGQNPDIFYMYYFSPTSGYTAVPGDNIPGPAYSTARIRNGFCLDSNGDLWVGFDKTNAITHYPRTGFDSNNKPIYGPAVVTPTPSSIGTMTRLIYVRETDTMILASGITGSTDWTAIGTRVEVYHGWLAGNTTTPSPVITLTAANPKSITAAGNYLFVGYVHTVPNIDAFDLTTGANTITLTNSSPSTVYVGNDVDSMYGLRAYKRASGEYEVTKDNYNGISMIVYHWTP